MMWARLRRRLLISAAGRNLAVDLAAAHGPAAAERLEALIALGWSDDRERDILMKARREIGKIGFP